LSSPVRLTPSVADAIATKRPVVALESSVFAQGLPIPANAEAARRMTDSVRSRGAVPAIAAVVAGRPTLGLTDEELSRFLRRDGVIKLSARDIPPAMLNKSDGATTVAGTLALMAATPIRVFATGGIGGVHRDPPYDESADLAELAHTPVIVICAGAKSILDLQATMERLETLGVPVVGYRTRELPGFFYADTGVPLAASAETAGDVARLYGHHLALGRLQAVLVVQPPPPEAALPREEVERAVERAIAEAMRAGIRGAAMTPHLLAALDRATGGRSLAANLSLLEANAALAAEIAAELAAE
jgi:pseudouridine-5'-phosphate glycosidase